MTDEPVIDTDMLMAQFEGDHDLLQEVAELFLSDYQRHLESMRSAIAASDAELVEHAAHTLKGAVSNFAARAAVSAAAVLEKQGRERRLGGSAEALSNLERQMARLDVQLRALVDQAA